MLIGLLEHQASTKDVVIFKKLYVLFFCISNHFKWQTLGLKMQYVLALLSENKVFMSLPPVPDQMERAAAIPPDMYIHKGAKHSIRSITVPGPLKCLDTIGWKAEWMLSFYYNTGIS